MGISMEFLGGDHSCKVVIKAFLNWLTDSACLTLSAVYYSVTEEVSSGIIVPVGWRQDIQMELI